MVGTDKVSCSENSFFPKGKNKFGKHQMVHQSLNDILLLIIGAPTIFVNGDHVYERVIFDPK